MSEQAGGYCTTLDSSSLPGTPAPSGPDEEKDSELSNVANIWVPSMRPEKKVSC